MAQREDERKTQGFWLGEGIALVKTNVKPARLTPTNAYVFYHSNPLLFRVELETLI